jgi:protein-tyrosine phosphatase
VLRIERGMVAEQELHVAVICTGNICRSPMAEVVLNQLVMDDPSLASRVLVSSAGTARWHVGSPMDPRARAALDRAGFRGPGTQDLIVVMTREHFSDVRDRLSSGRTKIVLLRDVLDPDLLLDVPDPYYGSHEDFDACVALFRQAGQRLTAEFRRRLDAYSREV